MSEKNPVIIKVCMGSSCFARGNIENLQLIEKYIKDRGVAAKIDLCGERCANLCAKGPRIVVGETVYTNVTAEKTIEILQGLEDKQ